MGAGKGGAEINCPDPSKWFQIAAGVDHSDSVDPLLEHAALCDQCGPRLKDAIGLTAQQNDVSEDQFLAELASSQPGWQKKMARKLASRAASTSRKSNGLWWNWRLATAFAVMLSAIVIFWLARWRHTRDQVQPKLEAHSGTTSIPSSPANRPIMSAVPEPKAKATHFVAFLTLEPGLTRGLEHSKVLTLSAEIKTVSLTLLFLTAPPEKLHLLLTDSAQQTIWSSDEKLTSSEVSHQRTTISIPASTMHTSDYQLVASEQTETGNESIATYAFRVTR